MLRLYDIIVNPQASIDDDTLGLFIFTGLLQSFFNYLVPIFRWRLFAFIFAWFSSCAFWGRLFDDLEFWAFWFFNVSYDFFFNSCQIFCYLIKVTNTKRHHSFKAPVNVCENIVFIKDIMYNLIICHILNLDWCQCFWKVYLLLTFDSSILNHFAVESIY